VESVVESVQVPQGETLDFFDIFHYMRCETEEDLREAATEMQTRFAARQKIYWWVFECV
jgi:propanediol dehydratase small subunit